MIEVGGWRDRGVLGHVANVVDTTTYRKPNPVVRVTEKSSRNFAKFTLERALQLEFWESHWARSGRSPPVKSTFAADGLETNTKSDLWPMMSHCIASKQPFRHYGTVNRTQLTVLVAGTGIQGVPPGTFGVYSRCQVYLSQKTG